VLPIVLADGHHPGQDFVAEVQRKHSDQRHPNRRWSAKTSRS
jgi:hypothetical protein